MESFLPQASLISAEESATDSMRGGFAKVNLTDSNITSRNSASLPDRHLLLFHGNFEALVGVPSLQVLEEISIVIVTGTAENPYNKTCKPTVVKADEVRCELNRRGLVEGKDYPVVIRVNQFTIHYYIFQSIKITIVI